MNMIKSTIGTAVACGAARRTADLRQRGAAAEDRLLGRDRRGRAEIVRAAWWASGGSRPRTARRCSPSTGGSGRKDRSSAGIADKARALYGDRYAEFLDRVQAYAYFPYAVAKDVDGFHATARSRVRFEGIVGPHRSGRRNPVQPQAQRRLPDDPRQSARKQSGAVEVREGQALVGQMDPQHADRDAPVARPQGPRSAGPRSTAISTASSTWSTSCRSRSRDASACGPRPTAMCTSTTSP